jgi:small-conductance mechanosensitive channel
MDIGKQLAANPDFAPYVLEPLKMQGVEQFGEYAIQIRMKMMTKPGHQFTIRRKALAAINEAFAENGIEFARPTVRVAGDVESAPAAAAGRIAAMESAAAKEP